MSEHRLIACANCGSKYRLPPSFQGQKARCKNCGATIEIATSIVSPEAEASSPAPAPKPKAKPAEPKARPAAAAGRGSARSSARSSRTEAAASGSRRGARAGARAGAARGGRRGRDDDDEGQAAGGRHGRAGARGRGGARGRRGGDVEEAPNRTGMVVGVGIAVVAVAVALFFLLGNNGDQGTGGGNAGQGNGQTAKAGGAADQVAKPDEATAKADEVAKPEEATAKTDETGKADEATAKTDETGKDDGAKKPDEGTAKTGEGEPEKPKHTGPGYLSTPFDAKTEIAELPWAPDTTEEEKKEIAQMVHDAFYDDSIVGMRAQRALLGEYSRKAYPAIVNVLREADYMDSTQNMQAYNFHTKVVMKLLHGVNVPYNAGKTVGEQPVQEQAWWNAKCVVPLANVWAQLGNGDKEQWDAYIAKRKASEKKDESEDEDF